MLLIKAPPQSISTASMTLFLLNNYSTIAYDYRNERESTVQYAEFWSRAALDQRLVNNSINDIVALAGYAEASKQRLNNK